MKKILSWLLIAAILLGLAGCWQEDAGEVAATDTAVEKNDPPEVHPVEKDEVTEPAEKEPAAEDEEEPVPTPDPELEKPKAQAKKEEETPKEENEPEPMPDAMGTPLQFDTKKISDVKNLDYTRFKKLYAPNSEGDLAIRIESRDELQYLMGQAASLLAQNEFTPQIILELFEEQLAFYDASYFEDKVLFLIPFLALNGGNYYHIKEVTIQEEELHFWVEYWNRGATQVVEHSLHLVEISKDAVDSCKAYKFHIYDISYGKWIKN